MNSINLKPRVAVTLWGSGICAFGLVLGPLGAVLSAFCCWFSSVLRVAILGCFCCDSTSHSAYPILHIHGGGLGGGWGNGLGAVLVLLGGGGCGFGSI